MKEEHKYVPIAILVGEQRIDVPIEKGSGWNQSYISWDDAKIKIYVCAFEKEVKKHGLAY